MPAAPYNYGRPHAIFKSNTERFSFLGKANTDGPIYNFTHPKDISATTTSGPRKSAVFCSGTERFKGSASAKDADSSKLTTTQSYTPTTPEGRCVVSPFKSKTKRAVLEPSQDTSVGYIYSYNDPRSIGSKADSRPSSAFVSKSARFSGGYTAPTATAALEGGAGKGKPVVHKPVAQGPDPMLTYPSDISQVVNKSKAVPSAAFNSATTRFNYPESVSPFTSYLSDSLTPSNGPGASSAFRSKSPRYPEHKSVAAEVNYLEKFPTDIAVRVGSGAGKPTSVFASKSKRTTEVDAPSSSPGFIYDGPKSALQTFGGAVAAFKSGSDRFKDPKVDINPESVLQRNVRYPTDIAVVVEEYAKR